MTERTEGQRERERSRTEGMNGRREREKGVRVREGGRFGGNQHSGLERTD